MRRDLLLVLLASAALILSFPSAIADGLGVLAWIALAPLIYLISSAQQMSVRRAFLLGELTGLLFFYGSCYWLSFPIIHFGGLPRIVAYGLLIIPALILALFFGLFTALLRKATQQFGNIGILAAAPTWVVTEWLRFKLTGHGWNALGYSQAFHPELIQFARWSGVYGVSFLLVMASSIPVFLALELRQNRSRFTRAAVLGGGITVASLALAFASAKLPVSSGSDSFAFGPGQAGGERSSLSVVAIQPVIEMTGTGSDLEAPDLSESLALHMSLSEEGLSASRSDGRVAGSNAMGDAAVSTLLIWPESPMNMSLDEDPMVERLVTEFARSHRLYLLVNHLGKAPSGGYHNSAAVISPDGRRIADYHKTHLLVFGEYVPLRGILPLVDKIPALAGDFVPGRDYTLAAVNGSRVGTFICFESAFPEIAREMTRRGATLLVNISNDNWFGNTAGAHQHLAHAVFRAVENNRPLVRGTNSGISTLITPCGEVKSATRLFQRGFRTWSAEQPRDGERLGLTLYSRCGDLFVLLCAISGLIAFGQAVLPRRQP